MKEKSDSSQGQPRLGVKDFVNFAYDSQPEWTLLAVNAPLEQAAGAFADLRKTDRWIHDVPLRDAIAEDDVDSSLAFAVQIKGNPWTIIVRELFYVTEAGLREIVQDAKALSIKFKTKAISFVAEDTSGALGYELFDSGKSLEKAEWEDGGEFFTFKSTLRKQPELQEVGGDFADEVFRELGICLPACYPKSQDEEAWICVEKVLKDWVERADLIGLEVEDDEEDEDEEDEEDEEE